MNITAKRLLKIRDLKLEPWWILILYHIQQGSPEITEIMRDSKVRGMVNLMVHKGYMTKEGLVTGSGELILSQVIDSDTELIASPSVSITETPVATSFDQWVSDLLIKIRGVLKEKTGKEQARGFEGKPFVPNITDFKGSLMRFREKYKLWDLVKVEEMLLHHTTTCIDQKKFIPVLQYYVIHKERGSRMADDWDSFDYKEDKPVFIQQETIEDNAVNI